MFPIARHDSIFSCILPESNASFKGDIKSNFTHSCRTDSKIYKLEIKKFIVTFIPSLQISATNRIILCR